MKRTKSSADDTPNLSTEALVNELRQRILSGAFDLTEGRLPTLAEIETGAFGTLKAKRYAGREAFRILLHEGLIETRGKQGTFVRGATRKQKRTTRPGLIGLVAPSLHFDFIRNVTEGIAATLDRWNADKATTQRYRLLCAYSKDSWTDEGKLLRQMSQEVDGIILCPTPTGERDRDAFDLLRQASLPLLTVGRSVTEFETHARRILYPERIIGPIVGDFIAAKVRASTASKIYVVGERGNPGLVKRAEEIIRSLQKHFGSNWSDIVQEHLVWEVGENAGAATADYIISATAQHSHRPLVVCTSDLVALGVLQRFRQEESVRGRFRVPQDALVMGVDGDSFCPYLRPSLTSLSLNPRTYGERTAEVMIKMIEEHWSPPSFDIFVPEAVGTIIERESTDSVSGLQSVVP
jgi:DNA-binding LacI/PurR family transcriptional regulator